MEFKRERRYIVFKLGDFGMRLRAELEQHEDYVGRIRESHGKDRRKFLVIESDWPEYEPTWEAIRRRIAGDLPELNRLEQELALGTAVSDIECACFAHELVDGRWYDTADMADDDEFHVRRAMHYLDLRGLLERHSENPTLIRPLAKKAVEP